MTRALTILGTLVLVVAASAFAAPEAAAAPVAPIGAHVPASFDWGVGVGFGGTVHPRPHYVGQRVTYVSQPIYQTVFVGYDVYGQPIYNQVIVGYRQVPVYQPVYRSRWHVHPTINVGFGYWHR